MLSLRLKTIASLVDKGASVVDIGTDHAYIPIYLVQNNITDKVLASDVSEKVINYSKRNIIENGLEKKIPTIVSDGFKNIDRCFDIAIIAGMGTHAIMDILTNGKNVSDTLIIQSNNDLDKLRYFMNELGYRIDIEKVIYEEKYYTIIKYRKGQEVLSEEEILFGKSGNVSYYKYLLEKYINLYHISKKQKFLDYSKILEKIIERIQV